MSIKGVDSQIMVARTSEYVRDSAAQLKKGELNQEFLAVKAEAEAAAEQTRVAGAEETEQASLALDAEREGASGGGYTSGRGNKNKNEDEDDAPGRLVPPGENMIDIRI